MITEGAFASATSTATAFAVPKQNGCYQPFLSRSTTSTKPMIVEPVKNQARASRPVRCMSDTQTHPRPTNSHDLLTSQLSHFFGFKFSGQVGIHWSHFSATTTIGQKEVSVLIFERKNNIKGPTRLGRTNRLGLIDLLKYDITQLAQLAHPRILQAMHQITSENRDLISFASEPILCTLDQLFDFECSHFDAQNTIFKKKRLLELSLGILQVIEGLSYLHNSAKILHGNLTPSAVYITKQQYWKIGGFAFSISSKKTNQFPCFPWTKKLPACLQPDLNFLAPEYLDPETKMVGTTADVFSLGTLIYYIITGGRKLIDVNNNIESYMIVIDQLDVALDLLSEDRDFTNLGQSLRKVLSRKIEERPAAQMLAFIKHFDHPSIHAIRQLDDFTQEFDPVNRIQFLSQSLYSALQEIPEPLWFSRILVRFDQQLIYQNELFPALLRPLTYILANCESHNIYLLKPWFRRILNDANEALYSPIIEAIAVFFRRLNDEQVEDKCFDLLISLLSGPDPHLKQSVIRIIPQIAEFLPRGFISTRLVPTLQLLGNFLEQNISRQIDLLAAIANLSDQCECDTQTLNSILKMTSLCNTLHPAIVHSKSRLVQRILTHGNNRLNNIEITTRHLLGPLVLGLSLDELTPSHFDDVMSSCRILLDIVEQQRYEPDDIKSNRTESTGGGLKRFNRRVSMSSNHLPRLLITAAARPSVNGGDGRKMSFLSADGRLEDQKNTSSRRESRDSRCSFESDVSLKLGGSDISADSSTRLSSGSRHRRQNWLEGYLHSGSLEQSSSLAVEKKLLASREVTRKMSEISEHMVKNSNRRYSPTNSQNANNHDFLEMPRYLPTTHARPNSATRLSNLGHNLACTLWKTFY